MTLTFLVTVLLKLACWIVRTDCVMSEDIDYDGRNMAEKLPNCSGALIPYNNPRLDTDVENQLNE